MKKIIQLTLIGMCTLPALSLAQFNTKQSSKLQDPSQKAETFQTRQEIEIDFRAKMISSTQKAIECIKKSVSVDMIASCKREENYELHAIKQEKKQAEQIYLTRKKNSSDQISR